MRVYTLEYNAESFNGVNGFFKSDNESWLISLLLDDMSPVIFYCCYFTYSYLFT